MTRKTQPYRRGKQQPGMVLDAMLKGAPAYLPNPQDQARQLQHLLAVLRRRRG
jgi:hypothetical protein